MTCLDPAWDVATVECAIKVTGVLVAVAGTIIVAPGGAKLTWDRTRERSQRSAAAAKALWRWISGRPAPLQTVEASGIARWGVSGGGVGTVIGGFRPGPGASTEEYLQLQRAYIEDVERRLNQLAKHVHAVGGA